MKTVALLLLPALALCQTNLKFQDGAPGQAPTGWFALDAVKDAGYAADWVREGCRAESPCAVLAAPDHPPAQSFGTLMQSFSAAPYRGMKVRLQAWIKVEGKTAGDHAQMLLHVTRTGGGQGFVDNMADRPIGTGDWRRFQIDGEVSPDAESIGIGLLLFGEGRAWISEVEFRPPAAETSGPAVDSARAAIKQQYARLDAAFVDSDPDDLANVLMPGAMMGVGTIREPLLPAIQQEIASGSKLTTRTAISSVRLDGDEAVAIVRRVAEDPTSNGARSVVTSHRDTWIQTSTGWRWRESIEISYHWILPPTSAGTARQVAAELKKRAVPLDGAAGLAALGAAVGDARIVALGEAVHGAREFVERKSAIAEYLITQKGFTSIAAAKESEVHDLAARLNVSYMPLESVAAAQSKVVVWTDNSRASDLRGKLGRKVYAVGLLFGRGTVRAIGVEGGESRGLNVYTAGKVEGSGDAVLAAAGLPRFFLNLAAMQSGALGRWLADQHLFHNLGAYWVLDDPEAALQPEDLSKCYDRVVFVEEVHADR